MSMDNSDKQLLNLIQTNFPICHRPYAELGAKLGLTEAETLARVRALRGKKILRRLGANFSSAKLGWRSSLCAAKVPPEQLEAFTAEINQHSGATHNYLRDHNLNVWFTFIAPSWEKLCQNLADITQKTGIEIMNLPATKLYKIKVDFKFKASN